jgi:hypothetical protein
MASHIANSDAAVGTCNDHELHNDGGHYASANDVTVMADVA